MKIKDKIKSYSFWVSLASAVILILKVLGNRFGFTVDETMVSDLFTALCSILVLLGIIVVPNNSNIQLNTQKDVNNSLKNINEIGQTDNKLENDTHLIINQNETLSNESKDNSQANFDSSSSTKQENHDIEINKDICTSEIIDEMIDKEQTSIEHNETIGDVAIVLKEDTCNDNHNTEDCVDDVIAENCTQNNLLECNDEINTQPISNVSNLKELFNIEREKFTQNINEYIFELQEEIRKAREKM